ncbi:MAG: (2Fe-2S)-binding protein [Geminocystis sp.]|nr:(2Fe-2S)-binding protein [Geminocystis sp.]HIK37054.1 (2Fe-2S)-binding protein [Geminocystis sp. M7585_C2015_104]MCS7148950.1 (2Fe-2S)-binding protein [Geminocystis sp.]MCX8077540.1 (2Fe-2S)-binding protein [Geminocystis sp.]MDW8117203.1 (2Fe-2S)-binding protein [Geminocystis sp.]
MYVCLCYQVTDRDIYKAVEEGVNSLEQLAEKMSVSRCCGCCAEYAEVLIAEANRGRRENKSEFCSQAR